MKHRRAFRTVCCTAAAVLSLTATAAAAGPRWRQATPFGGLLVALAEAPSAPRVLYAGALTGRIFRSGDGGETPLNQGLPLQGFLGAVVLDPRHSSVLYAASPSQGIFRLDLDATEP